MLSTDAKQLLASFVPLRLRAHIHATLHRLHAAGGSVVAHIEKRSNFTGRIKFVRLQFHRLLSSTLLEAAATRISEQFVDVLADLAEVNFGRRFGCSDRRQDMYSGSL